MAKTEQYFKGLSEGTSTQITQGETFDKDKLYIVDDIPSNNGITNAKMAEILNDVLARAFVNINDTYVCSDTGTYLKGHIYKFTGTAWEDITPLPDLSNTVEKEVTDEGFTTRVENTGVDFQIDFTENGLVNRTALINKEGFEFIDNDAGEDFRPKINQNEHMAYLSDVTWEPGTGDNSSQTKNTGCQAKGEDSVAEGSMSMTIVADNATEDWNEGKGAHAEGGNTMASGNYSHTEGNSTVTNNPYEHAEGHFNISNFSQAVYPSAGNTIHSVGIGSNLSNRKNATEIMQNGDQYVIGIGGYDGTNISDASTLQEVIEELEEKEISVDNRTITLNNGNQLQAVAVIDANTGLPVYIFSDLTLGDYLALPQATREDTSNIFYIKDDNIIDIGSLQVSLNDKVYPKMTVADAKKIKQTYIDNGAVNIKWTVLNVATYFSPIYFTEASNQFVVFLHGRLIKYEWLVDAADTVEITPDYADEQSYIHTINVSHTTAQGTWKYQFQFKDEDATVYQWLYDVASHLNDEYTSNGSVATLPASGTYTTSADTFIVTGIKPANSSQIEVLLLSLTDKSETSITTGAIPVTDWVH